MDNERAYRCGLYLPGHDVHVIQWKRATRGFADPGSAPVPGHLLEVHSSGVVVAEVSGVIHRWWIHDPQSLKRLAADNGGAISYGRRFRLLGSSSPGGCRLFYVADADDPSLRPCPTTPPQGEPIDLLKAAGGFMLPGAREGAE